MNDNARRVLETPFPEEEIRTRKGNFGKELAYAEVHNYIARMNDAFAGDWSFDILEHQIMDAEVIVLGRISAGGVEKTAFGCSAITTSRDTGEKVSLGDDLKAAASDALKKCSSLLGLGLHLYGMKMANEAPPDNPVSFPERRSWNGNGGLLTARQRGAILALAGKVGYTEAQLKTRVLDLYGAPLDKLDRRQASEVISQLSNGSGKAVGGAA
jgi:hypothetical protein